MPSPLATAVAAPASLKIGGQVYACQALRYLEWGRYERWYQQHAIGLLVAAGVPHEEAAYAASRIYGKSEPVSASRLTMQGQLVLVWLGIREAITLEQVGERITDEEMLEAIRVFAMLNMEPYDPKGPAPQGAMKRLIRRIGSFFSRQRPR